MTRSPSVPYIAPFAVFLAMLSLHSVVPLPELADQVLRIAVPGLALALVWRRLPPFRVERIFASVGVGILVFVVWIGVSLVFPGYRHHWLFENALLGYARTSMSEGARSSTAILTLRCVRAALLVPVVEELFWRGWLMRWFISPSFQKVPMGAYQPAAFWLSAVLFAAEHGSYWDVGLAAGVIYNWWMIRTRSVGDLILAHAVTNACLSAYVIAAGKWEYWL